MAENKFFDSGRISGKKNGGEAAIRREDNREWE